MFKKVNEKGQALVMVLFCSVIAILFVVAVLYMVQRGEQSSGAEKRYETALDAADAGVSVSVKLLDNKSLTLAAAGAFQTGVDAALAAPLNGSCIMDKLEKPCTTSGCSSTTWPGCTNPENFTVDPEESPDVTFTIRGTSTAALYDVSAKIVDSRRGVTGSPPGNLSMGGVVNSDGALTPVKLPYFYYIVEVAARQRDRDELARLTYIYAD